MRDEEEGGGWRRTEEEGGVGEVLVGDSRGGGRTACSCCFTRALQARTNFFKRRFSLRRLGLREQTVEEWESHHYFLNCKPN